MKRGRQDELRYKKYLKEKSECLSFEQVIEEEIACYHPLGILDLVLLSSDQPKNIP
jgi:hypothetical protein